MLSPQRIIWIYLFKDVTSFASDSSFCFHCSYFHDPGNDGTLLSSNINWRLYIAKYTFLIRAYYLHSKAHLQDRHVTWNQIHWTMKSVINLGWMTNRWLIFFLAFIMKRIEWYIFFYVRIIKRIKTRSIFHITIPHYKFVLLVSNCVLKIPLLEKKHYLDSPTALEFMITAL